MRLVRVLIAEDNEDHLFLARVALQAVQGVQIEVVAVQDGQEALDFLFGNDARQPCKDLDSLGLVLLDVKLPKVSGLEVLKGIRSSPLTNWLPVVMVTSSDEPADLLNAYRLGANSFITKSINYREFTEQMKLLARYWLFVNKVPKAGAVRSL